MLLLLTLPLRAQHNVWVRPDGLLWTWGRNTFGQLGDGTLVSKRVPTVISPGATWRMAVTGGSHTVAIRADGTLWTWGYNNQGQLGTGANNPRMVPGQLGTATWRSVGAGELHTVAVRADGTLWAWGQGGNGRLGYGGVAGVLAPRQIGTATDWQSVVAGSDFTLGLKTDGTLWAWGHNDSGQLGDGSTTDRLTPVQIGTATTWRSVRAGYAHTVALRQDGSAWAWGWNGSGQLGQASTGQAYTTPQALGAGQTWRDVAAGGDHTVAVRADGTLWGCGYNEYGQLGDSTSTSRPNLTRVGNRTNWHSVLAGSVHTIAARQDGTLWGWGFNPFGQVGSALLGMDYETAPFPVQPGWIWRSVSASDRYSLAVRADGTLWGWGENNYGQLGDSTLTERPLPVQIGRATNWLSVVAGRQHVMGLKTDGTLWAWGNNGQGQLGLGTTGPTTATPSVPRQVGTATNWRSVALGSANTLALRQDGSLWSWGDNQLGGLGDGTTISRSVPGQIGLGATWLSITAGGGLYHAIRTDGTLWGWGVNTVGQVGDGTTTTRRSPVQIGTSSNWQSIDGGSDFALAVRQDGTLWTWGYNLNGQLGNGSTGLGRTSPAQVGTSTAWRSTQAYLFHCLAIRQDGTLWSWGENESGQLGNGTVNVAGAPNTTPSQASAAQWTAVSSGAIHSVGLQANGTLWAWGSSSRSALGIPDRSMVPLLIAGNAVVLAARPSSTLSTSFVAYPTVAADAVEYAYAGPTRPAGATLELLRLTGQRVARWPAGPAAQGRLAVAGLAPGWYLLRLSTAQGSYVARFFRP
ncbi:hypothetical protein GCM10028821_33420 [Hymenobacter jeollabukensis]